MGRVKERLTRGQVRHIKRCLLHHFDNPNAARSYELNNSLGYEPRKVQRLLKVLVDEGYIHHLHGTTTDKVYQTTIEGQAYLRELEQCKD